MTKEKYYVAVLQGNRRAHPALAQRGDGYAALGAAGQLTGVATISTEQFADLQKTGLLKLPDGRVVKIGYNGNQVDSGSMVKLAKGRQLALFRINNAAGKVAGPLLVLNVGADTLQYVNGDISGLRFGYRMLTTGVALTGPQGAVISATMWQYEFMYDFAVQPVIEYHKRPDAIQGWKSFLTGGLDGIFGKGG